MWLLLVVADTAFFDLFFLVFFLHKVATDV